MGSRSAPQPDADELRRLRRRLQRLDPGMPQYRTVRSDLVRDIQLAKQNIQHNTKRGTASRSPKKTPQRTQRKRTKKATSTPATTTRKKANLSKLLSPENIQESLKTVGNLRKSVKNWLQYLQQADQLLDTVFVTSNSLKESGVLDKIIKSRGKNLSTDDFTNILVALMNSPIGSQLMKGSEDKGNAAAQASE